MPIYIFLVLLILGFIWWSFYVLREYERAVVFRLGRFTGVRGPGFTFLFPMIEQMERLELRTIVMDVPSQDVISRDNVSVKVNAVVYFRVVDPEKSVIQVVKFFDATSQLAQTTLRAILGKHELDELLSERERRAKVIHAEGELQASEKLLQAAQMLSQQPQAMQLRYLQTLTNIACDKSSTIIFPMPMDIFTILANAKGIKPPEA